MAVDTNKRPVLFENLVYYNTKDKAWTKEQIEKAISAGALTIDDTREDSNFSKVYDFYNGSIAGLDAEQKAAKRIGTINIPKDMVVSSGEVVTLTAGQVEGLEAGTYIKLTLANAANDTLYIPANALVDVYTAVQNAEQVQIVITGHEISAGIVAGSITTTELSAGVVASLGKADSALQASDVTTGGSDDDDGTISVKGSAVAVKGYASLASDVTDLAYDVASLKETAEATISKAEIEEMFAEAENDG